MRFSKKQRFGSGQWLSLSLTAMLLVGTPAAAFAEPPEGASPPTPVQSEDATELADAGGSEESDAPRPTSGPGSEGDDRTTVSGTIIGFDASRSGRVSATLPGSDMECWTASPAADTGAWKIDIDGYAPTGCELTDGKIVVSYLDYDYLGETDSAPFGYAQSYWAGAGLPATAVQADAVEIEVVPDVAVTDVDIDPILNGRIVGQATHDFQPGSGSAEWWTLVVATPHGIAPDTSTGAENAVSNAYIGDANDEHIYWMNIAPGTYTLSQIGGEQEASGLRYTVLGMHDGVLGSDPAASAPVVVTAGEQISDVDIAPPSPGVAVTRGEVSITGDLEIGRRLSATTSGWGPSGVALTYQWYRNGISIAGATAEHYRLVGDDVGSRLTVRVTGALAGYTSSWRTSEPTAKLVDTSPGSATVTVVDADGAPLADAWVSVQSESNSKLYFAGNASSGGTVTVPNLTRESTYRASATNALGQGTGSAEFEITELGEHVDVNVRVVVPKLPGNVQVGGSFPSGNGISVNIAQEHKVTIKAAPDATEATLVVNPGGERFTLTESRESATESVYSAVLPPRVAVPDGSGNITLTYTLKWANGDVVTDSFKLRYTDPSGHVVDRYGTPIDGASVTLSRSATEDGVFETVTDGDTSVMDPAINTVNPWVTPADGKFRWDVVPGWYTVSAEALGTKIESPALPVPPEQLDLVLALEAGDVPEAKTAPAISGEVKVGNTVKVSSGTWPTVTDEPAKIKLGDIQWRADGAAIAGATDAAYAITPADEGKQLTVDLSVGRDLTPTAGAVEPWSVSVDAGKVAASQNPPTVKPEDPEGPEKPDKTEKPDTTDKSDKSDKPGATDKADDAKETQAAQPNAQGAANNDALAQTGAGDLALGALGGLGLLLAGAAALVLRGRKEQAARRASLR